LIKEGNEKFFLRHEGKAQKGINKELNKEKNKTKIKDLEVKRLKKLGLKMINKQAFLGLGIDE